MSEGKLTEAQQDYTDLVAAAALALEPNAFWLIGHAEGPLEQTASKDVTFPIRTICMALDRDWDELRESGFYLTRSVLSTGARL